MKVLRAIPPLFASFATLVTLSAADIPVKVTVDVAHPGHAISPLLHGVFFEDINYGADGGLYAELVQNRSFEHGEHLYAWGTVNRGGAGDVSIETADPLNAKNTHFARLNVRELGTGFGLANYGYGGVSLSGGETYWVSTYARGTAGNAVTLALEDDTGRPLGEVKLTGLTGGWKKFEGSIKTTGSAVHGRVLALATSPGTLDLDMISVFPEHTFKDRRNGLRSDLAQKVADLHPAFVRFPGGCIVEGRDLPNRYQWKDTIGDVAERPENWNRWQDAIKNQLAPQYYQTYGLGFFEYFQFCEDLGAEPVPILNCGMACQYESKQLVPLNQLEPYIQDALDLIEFANGDVSTPWGAKRAAMGHPQPFNLKFVGVGNEQWGEDYFARYSLFTDTLKAKHPEIHVVSGAGPGVDDKSWQLAWQKFRSGTSAYVVDEHYYRPPQWFLENATRYDHQDRNGPKVFAGEFAAHDQGRRSTLRAAVSEAAFMTGLVRNSDLVIMSSYAPLFARSGSVQWAPDLIWFDNSRAYGTASYYTQWLFSRNRADILLPITIDGAPVDLALLPAKSVATYGASALPPYKPESIPTVYAAAGQDGRTKDAIIFLVNPFAEARAAAIHLSGMPTQSETAATKATAFVLTSATPDDVNSFEEPIKVVPREEMIPVNGSVVNRSLPPYSITVLRVPSAGGLSH